MFLTQGDELILQEIRTFLESSTQHPIHIHDLIIRFGLRESKLSKGFQKLFGCSIYTYYRNCTMKQAHCLLERGASVKEVAITFGYSTTRSFSRGFLKVHGILPSAISLR